MASVPTPGDMPFWLYSLRCGGFTALPAWWGRPAVCLMSVSFLARPSACPSLFAEVGFLAHELYVGIVKKLPPVVLAPALLERLCFCAAVALFRLLLMLAGIVVAVTFSRAAFAPFAFIGVVASHCAALVRFAVECTNNLGRILLRHLYV